MATADGVVGTGRTETHSGGKAKRYAASRGLRTMRDVANINACGALDVLDETLGTREASAFFSGMREARRAIVDGQKIGYEKHVLDHEGDSGEMAATDRKECIRRRKAELTAELERLVEAENV